MECAWCMSLSRKIYMLIFPRGNFIAVLLSRNNERQISLQTLQDLLKTRLSLLVVPYSLLTSNTFIFKVAGGRFSTSRTAKCASHSRMVHKPLEQDFSVAPTNNCAEEQAITTRSFKTSTIGSVCTPLLLPAQMSELWTLPSLI
jgi:hypothetical protein